jgi:CheY-like chemotaxis protein
MVLSKEALSKPAVILLADDDEDDLLLTRDAFFENRLENDLRFVRNGEELIDYLTHKGAYTAENAPKPDLILLDLNMPRRDGREALKIIKSDIVLRRIPVVVFTTSKAEEDIKNSYELGVNSFITKPMSFHDMLRITKSIGDYWFQVVSLPN